MPYPKTDQEIFDLCVSYLWAQNSQGTDGKGACMYRGLNKKKCGIGIFIEDEDYHTEMEWNSLNKLRNLTCCPDPLKTWINDHFFLLTDLQALHDNYQDIFSKDFHTYLQKASDVIADQYKLIHFFTKK